MNEIGEGIWIHEDVMDLMGTKLRLRMTVVKLQEGGLWIHSPTKLSKELKLEVDKLGIVAFVVGASNGHNTWLGQWQEAYPKADLYVSSGIPDKVTLKSYTILDGVNNNIWAADLIQAAMPEVPFFNESVFFHRKTNSLIVTDLIQNHEKKVVTGVGANLAQSLFRLLGFKEKCVAPPLKMGFMRKDKAGFAEFIEQVNNWDFDKIIVTHGDSINENAKTVFSQLCERFRQ